MKNLILFALILGSITTVGQDYHKLINEFNYWDVPYHDMGYICTGYGETGPFRYKISGDTVINEITYSKIYRSSFINLNPPPSANCPPFVVDTVFSLYPYYFLREDTVERKVWRYSNYSGEDELLYDFTLVQGDSIENLETGTFHTIDTIYSIVTNDGISRKMFEYGEGGFSPGGHYIEGIGGIAGLFEVPFHFFEEGTWLSCVRDVNNFNIYGNSQCYDFITGIDYQKNKNSIGVYPNPFSTSINIKTSLNKPTVKVFDLLGTEVHHSEINPTISLNLSSLEPGIYLLKIFEEMNEVYSKRIIKINDR